MSYLSASKCQRLDPNPSQLQVCTPLTTQGCVMKSSTGATARGTCFKLQGGTFHLTIRLNRISNPWLPWSHSRKQLKVQLRALSTSGDSLRGLQAFHQVRRCKAQEHQGQSSPCSLRASCCGIRPPRRGLPSSPFRTDTVRLVQRAPKKAGLPSPLPN